MTDAEDVSVIIPSLDRDVRTRASIPGDVEAIVVDDGTRAEARNIGAWHATGDIFVFCDDDIAFETDWFWQQIEQTPPGVVTGLEDFDFGLLLTRFMVVHAEDFWRVGGFDARLQHMEDTEFCLRCREHRIGLRALPRETVDHAAHANDVTTKMRVAHLWRLLRAHPTTFAPHLLDLVGLREWAAAGDPSSGRYPQGSDPEDRPAELPVSHGSGAREQTTPDHP